MQIVSNANCQCKTCKCNDVCEFYEAAIKPVIDVVEATVYDSADYTTTAFINKLVETLEGLYCDYYE